MELQESDRRILRLIQRDATLSLKDIADRAAMSPSTAWRRMQDLEEAGVITGRKTLADPAMLGLTVCVLLSVNIVVQNLESRQAFERFCEGHANILQCFTVTGAHDYVLIVYMKDVTEYERFLMEELLAHPSVASTHSQIIMRQTKNATELPV